MERTKWTELWRKAKAESGSLTGAEGGSLGTSESLRPLSAVNEDEDRAKKARNARYKLLRELSRNIWNGKLPSHSARHCSRRAIPSQRRKADGSIVKTKCLALSRYSIGKKLKAQLPRAKSVCVCFGLSCMLGNYSDKAGC